MSTRQRLSRTLAKSPSYLYNSRVLDRFLPDSRTAQRAPCFKHVCLRSILFVTEVVLSIGTHPLHIFRLQSRHTSIASLVVCSKKCGAGVGSPAIALYLDSRLTQHSGTHRLLRCLPRHMWS